MRINRLKINVTDRWGIGLRHKGPGVDDIGSGYSSDNGRSGFLSRAMIWYDREIKDNLRYSNPELTKEYNENW
jgi:hypothetical protein